MKKLLRRTNVGLLTLTMLIQITGKQPVQSVQATPDSYMQEFQESTPDPTATQQHNNHQMTPNQLNITK